MSIKSDELSIARCYKPAAFPDLLPVPSPNDWDWHELWYNVHLSCGNSFGDNDELNDFVKRKASGLGLRVQLESQSFLTCLDDDDKKHMIERQLVQLNRERGRHYYDYIVDRDSCKRPKDRPKRKLILEWMQYLLAKEDGAHLRYWRWTCNRAKGIEDVVGAGLVLTSEGDKIELRLARLY